MQALKYLPKFNRRYAAKFVLRGSCYDK